MSRFLSNLFPYKHKRNGTQSINLTLSAMAPWDLIGSWGGGLKVPGLLKASLNHHLTMKFCIYPQDVFRTRL